jgi:hypothetical protein
VAFKQHEIVERISSGQSSSPRPVSARILMAYT